MKINPSTPFINYFLKSPDGENRPSLIAIYLVIILFVTVAYSGSLRNGFVWDDETFIVTNRYVHDLSLWKEYFTTPESISSDPTLSRMYRPVQTISFALDALLWGNNAFGYHLSSFILHCACCAAIIFTFSSLIGLTPAMISAFIFAVHPALSEGILSLAARGNQLYTLFSLLSIGLFLRTVRPFDRNHLGSIIMLPLALFSKEPAVVLIAFLFMLQMVFKRPWKIQSYRSLLLYAPFLLMTALFLYARSAVVNTASIEPYWGGSLWTTLQMQAKVFMTYLSLLPWPFDLQGRYTISPPAPFPDFQVISAIALNTILILSAAVLYHKGKQGKFFALSIVWFYLSLLPVSNIIPIPGSMMGERFIYFTFAGMIPFLAASVALLPLKMNKVAASLVGVLVLSIWLITDISRTAVWLNNRTFFTLLSRQVPTDGTVQVRMAQEELASQDISSALARLERLLSTGSGHSLYQVHYWYAQALLAANRPADAYREFKIAAELQGNTPRNLVFFLAEAASRAGNFKAALSLLQEELKKSREDDSLWNALGNVYFIMGDFSSAIPAYEYALKMNPGNTEAASNLQTAFSKVSP